MDTMTKIAIGFAFAFILSLCGLLAFYVLREERKNAGKEMDEFDERQKNIRRKGFTIGFWVLLGCYTILAFLKECGVFNFGNEIIELVFAAYISFAVVMTYLIWHGASITPREEATHDGTYILSIFVGTMLTIMKFPYGGTKDIQNGFYLGILLLYIGVNQLAKRAWDKRRKKDSDDDEE